MDGSSSGKNLLRFALEYLVEFSFSELYASSVSLYVDCGQTCGTWNFALHLYELKMSKSKQLSLMIVCLFSFNQ